MRLKSARHEIMCMPAVQHKLHNTTFHITLYRFMCTVNLHIHITQTVRCTNSHDTICTFTQNTHRFIDQAIGCLE